MPDANRCDNCYHFSPIKTAANLGAAPQGECHRFPPIPSPIADNAGRMTTLSLWPSVKAGHVCGEHATPMQA